MQQTSISSRFSDYRLSAAYGLIAGVIAVGAQAGFDSPKGVPDSRKQKDGEPLVRAGRYPSRRPPPRVAGGLPR